MSWLRLFEDLIFLRFLILSAIPVVIYALWVDHYTRFLDGLDSREEEYDLPSALRQAHVLGWFVLIAELLVYWTGAEMKKAHPWVALAVFVSSLASQSWTRGRFEKKIIHKARILAKKPLLKPPPSNWKPLAWMGAVLFGYFASVNIMIWGSVLAGKWLGAGNETLYLLGGFGCLAGVMVGLFFSFAFSPFYLRKIFPIEELKDSSLRESIDANFKKAGVARPPKAWLLKTDQFVWNHPMLAGFRRGRGIFQSAFFFPEILTRVLDPAEVNALVLNEASRFSLNHYPRRFAHSIAVVVASMVITGVIVTAGHLFFSLAVGLVFKFAAIFIAFWLPFHLVKAKGERLQLEADLHSVNELGVEFKDLAQAWRKLDVIDEHVPLGGTFSEKIEVIAGNSLTERRIQKLRSEILKSSGPAAGSGDVKKSA